MKERQESFQRIKKEMDKINEQVLKELDCQIIKAGDRGMPLSECFVFMERRLHELTKAKTYTKEEFEKLIPPKPELVRKQDQ